MSARGVRVGRQVWATNERHLHMLLAWADHQRAQEGRQDNPREEHQVAAAEPQPSSRRAIKTPEE
ncbi:hypothetical protein AJ79_06862 [Helicocarpus griseus UAMH5409]|uniref:Uncharacterized protein n=1 Tax=Helicocarpus griseus UAMH5409 TaxID=1447875 RepID=A0A2B7X8Z7_9EURO|nr:hypothetical protein AJ79_06862 [Helicocarpus griseus UAMH5409]